MLSCTVNKYLWLQTFSQLNVCRAAAARFQPRTGSVCHPYLLQHVGLVVASSSVQINYQPNLILNVLLQQADFP